MGGLFCFCYKGAAILQHLLPEDSIFLADGGILCGLVTGVSENEGDDGPHTSSENQKCNLSFRQNAV